MTSGPSSNHTPNLTRLQRLLGYNFADSDLLLQAVTHKSFGPGNNERLEFLGDAVLGYLVGWMVFRHFEDVKEDSLSLMRSQLVRKESLAKVARSLDLAACLRIGASERNSGARSRDSLLADALEAVIGAVHEDGGVTACQSVVEQLFTEPMLALTNQELRDVKTQLQELLQGQGLALPQYAVVSTSGKDHDRSYTVSCAVPQLQLTATGTAGSRRGAEKVAAGEMLKQLEATRSNPT